jgi:C1A family cysteine protease
MAENSYKYTAKNGKCQYNAKNTTGVKNTGYTKVEPNKVGQMKSAVKRGPLSVVIEADKSVFQSYKSGIFNSTACGTHTDHATNVVGWGASGGQEYWIMRNSWGTSWGE